MESPRKRLLFVRLHVRGVRHRRPVARRGINVDALVDPRAFVTVVSPEIARAAGIVLLRDLPSLTVSHAKVMHHAPLAVVMITVGARAALNTVVAVSGKIAKAYGAKMIVGRDYMDMVGMRIDHAPIAMPGDPTGKRSAGTRRKRRTDELPQWPVNGISPIFASVDEEAAYWPQWSFADAMDEAGEELVYVPPKKRMRWQLA